MVASPNVGPDPSPPRERVSTVIVTVSVALAPPAVTVNSKVNVVISVRFGAVNVGVAVLAPVNTTVGGPPLCRHE